MACRKDEQKPAAPPAVAPAPVAALSAPVAVLSADGRINVSVTDHGFEPARIPAKAGVPLLLTITRKTDGTCARDIQFQGQDGKTELPLNQPVAVTYTPKVAGQVRFGCSMGMMVGGVLAVTD